MSRVSMPRACATGARPAWRGFSLVEMMIAMTIGLMLMTGLIIVFQGATRAHAELEQSSDMVQNGTVAMRMLGEEIAHAGFYGELHVLPVAAASLPDPCSVLSSEIYSAMPYAVQGYDAPAVSPPSCLLSTDHVAGTDIIVLRRAGPDALTAVDSTVSGWPYLQATPVAAEVQTGNGAVIGTDKKANGSPATLLRKDGVTAAEIRPLVVRIFFVAPCSVPADGGTRCTGAADDGGRPIPTLKVLALSAGGPTWTIQPLVEGIEDLQVEYGIDNLPASANALTGVSGDGVAENFATLPATADWPNVVSIKLRVLARSTRLSTGHVDIKTYDMGQAGVRAASNDSYRRHLFAAMFRLNNVAGRREIPQ
jgi:type IV pilus assembly protein PilW